MATHAPAYTLGPATQLEPDQVLSDVKRRKQSGMHLPGSRVGQLRASAMVRRRFHLEANEEVGIAVRRHREMFPTPEYDDLGFTMHEKRPWDRVCQSGDCVVLWWSEPGKPTSVYEEVFQLVSFEEIAKSTLHMPHGPRSTAYCRVPARFTYNGLEGFDVNMFWSVAIMIHTLGTSGVREWDTQFATLFGMPDDVDLPFANPAPTPALPADTPMTPDTYFDLRDDLVASKQKWLDDISSRNSAVEKAKDEGNTAFRAGEFDKAVLAYTRAIDRSGTVNVPIAPLHVLYGNRSAAHLKLSNPEASLGDAAMAVELAPLWSKAHFRVACALKALGRYAEAKAALRTLLESHPENNTALRELKELERLEPDGGTPVKGTPARATSPDAGDEAAFAGDDGDAARGAPTAKEGAAKGEVTFAEGS